MKTILLIPFILSAIFLTGCRDKTESARLDKMDIQIAKLELAVSQAKEDAYQARQENIKTLEMEQTNLLSRQKEMERIDGEWTNLMGIQLRLGQEVLAIETDYERFTNSAPRTAPIARGPPPMARPAAASALRAGIPATVYEGIAADAEKRFPGDYDEQVYIINEQVTAYKKLHP